jgi:DNA-binding NtrC family response regulator
MKTSDFKILIVDDEKSMREVLANLLETEEYTIDVTSSALEALYKYKKKKHDLIISDIMMQDMDGIGLLDELKQIEKDVKVILITGEASIDSAIQAIKLGAEDYFIKPLENIEILKVVERIYKNHSLSLQNEILKQELHRRDIPEIIGKSSKMKQVISDIQLVAKSDMPIFVTGESGTGKELVAQAIHNLSHRSNEPFVPINCAAIPNDLLESEFFGHEKGAFSGAVARKYGLFEAADKGTLFLDEIGEMPLVMQAKLLRTVETMQLRRIGATSHVTVDFRIVSCTNRDIQKEIHDGNFRRDLFYRLSSFEMKLPPLRERKEDIPLIIKHYLEKMGKNEKQVPENILRAFLHYEWPGNIRELIHVLERILLLSKNGRLDIRHIPQEIREKPYTKLNIDEEFTEYEILPLRDLEKNHILKVLNSFNGDKKSTAKILGIGLKTLYRKLNEYNM